MNKEQVEFWTFGCEDGNIVINFDKGNKYIKVSPKDIKSMMSWLMMDKGTYYPNWYKNLL